MILVSAATIVVVAKDRHSDDDDDLLFLFQHDRDGSYLSKETYEEFRKLRCDVQYFDVVFVFLNVVKKDKKHLEVVQLCIDVFVVDAVFKKL